MESRMFYHLKAVWAMKKKVLQFYKEGRPQKEKIIYSKYYKNSEEKLGLEQEELCQIHTKRLRPGREARGPSRAG